MRHRTPRRGDPPLDLRHMSPRKRRADNRRTRETEFCGEPLELARLRTRAKQRFDCRRVAMNDIATKPLSADVLRKIDAHWRAANYLAVGQIYLYDNPLLKKPLAREHIKPRLLGHWGTTPGLNFIYVHLNRVIKKYDLDALYVTGPGHGGPGLVANTYLEGTYSEVYPNISQDEEGMKQLFTQFSF